MKIGNKKININLIVAICVAIYAIVTAVILRANYLEYLELGQKYVEVFVKNIQYKYSIMAIIFVFLFIIIYMTNRGIKKGLKPFFNDDKKEMPKLPNKSIAIAASLLISLIVSQTVTDNILLFTSNVSFGIADPIYNQDISYYVFQAPLIQMILHYFAFLIVGITIYTALYYIIVFNFYCDGVNRETLRNSRLVKNVIVNVIILSVIASVLMMFNIKDMLFDGFLNISDSNNTSLIGAGVIDVTIRLWGYRILSLLIIISVITAVIFFKKQNTKRVVTSLAIVPIYLFCLTGVMLIYRGIFVKPNELDSEKDYILFNINYTKNAYNIGIDEFTIEDSGTITEEQVKENGDVIQNINMLNSEAIKAALGTTQTSTGYYIYPSTSIGVYGINGKDKLVYLSPREILTSGRTYLNKTFEYTHGYGAIVTDASNVTEKGNILNISKDIDGKDSKIYIKEPRIYFGLETNNAIALNPNKATEYDYVDESKSEDITYNYKGDSGLKLNFLDRFVLGVVKGNPGLAFSSRIDSNSQIIVNRNILERAKKVLPDLIYDENPYMVVTDSGKLMWVIDAYTYTDKYPYSQKVTIETNAAEKEINYIRNSIKVIVDAYTGEMKFYITDRTDPIAMAYRRIYSSIFEDINSKIPVEISKHFKYPEFLYNVQAEVLEQYHNKKVDVLYRNDDEWQIATYNNSMSNKASQSIQPYYTMVNTIDRNEETLGLVLPYTLYGKSNIVSYLVGTYENGEPKLTLYKYSSDSNVLGAVQLDKQIEQDEKIYSEIQSLNISGTKIVKNIIIVPIDNTLLYIEPIYQVALNEDKTYSLKKVVVASGSKAAIGDSFSEALSNLLSTYAVDIEIESTDELENIIQDLIKANNNLEESMKSNNWELIGSDLQRLQDIINQLEKEKNGKNESIFDILNQDDLVTNKN